MKKAWIFGILAILVLAAGGTWILKQRDRTDARAAAAHRKVKVPDNLPLTGVRSQGGVTIARLARPEAIDGFPCAADWVHFHESGRLRAFYLGETATIQGHGIPEGTWVRLNPDLTLLSCSFPRDTEIEGYVCRGGFGGSEGVTTGFHPGGRLSAFFPPEDIVIQGIPCRATPFGPIYLYENGNLRKFTLARDIVVGGRELSAGQTVALDEGGNLISVSSPSAIERVRSFFHGLFR